MKRHTILLLLLTFYFSAYCQDAVIHSLEKQVAASVNGKDKIIPLAKLAIYSNSVDAKRSLNLAQQAVELARRQNNNDYSLYSYSALASIWGSMDSIKLCHNTIDTCMQYLDKKSGEEAKIFAINRIVTAKLGLNDRDGIIDLLDQANIISAILRDDKFQVDVYYNFFKYYSYSDTENTGKYARLLFHLANQTSDPQLLVQACSAMGFYYQDLFEKVTKDPIYLDSAIYVLRKSINVADLNSDRVANQDKVTTLINISSTFSHKSRLTDGVINPAFADSISLYANKALKLAEEMKDPALQAYSYGILSEVDIASNRLDDAEVLLLKALSVVENTNNNKVKYILHTNMAGLYEMKKDYKKSLDHLLIAQQHFVAVNTEKYTKEGQILAAKYDLEKKEQEIQFRKKLNDRYIGIAIFLALTLIFSVLFFIYRMKYLKQKQQLLEQEKYEATLLVELKEAKAKRLQQEVVVSNMQLNYKNELLDNILNSFNIEKNQIEKVLNKELRIDNNFEDFRKELKEIHPDFYIKLQHRANQKLTSLDLKYCVCIFMKMSSKDIAELLHVENITVRMTKSRLKQKLNLSREENLNKFIESII